MTAIDASTLLRPGLLEHVSMLLALASPVGSEASLGGSVAAACARLGAYVCECRLAVDAVLEGQDDAIERAARDAVEQTLANAGGVQLLVVDAASIFSCACHEGGQGDRDDAARHALPARHGLRGCLDASWNVTRIVAERVFLPESRGGRIVYLAPRPDAGEYADAACAGLENLARTLSIEWARHQVTAVAIAPGAGADSGRCAAADAAAGTDEAAALTAYLASPAGAYFSGCLLDLRGPSRP